MKLSSKTTAKHRAKANMRCSGKGGEEMTSSSSSSGGRIFEDKYPGKKKNIILM